jgi:hypothetical protein
VQWIHLAQVRDKLCALVSTVMSIRLPYRAKNFLIFSRQLDSEEVLCFVELFNSTLLKSVMFLRTSS